jgi:hypothetical protein
VIRAPVGGWSNAIASSCRGDAIGAAMPIAGAPRTTISLIARLFPEIPDST